MLLSISKICEDIASEIGITPMKNEAESDEFSQIIINKKLNSYEKNKLICISACPCMGKTSLALDMVLDFALRSGKEVLVFSLDMSAKRIVSRLLQKLCEVNLPVFGDFTVNESDKNKLSSALAFLQELNILIDSSSEITPDYIEQCLQKYENAGLAVIDYLQLMEMKCNKNLCQRELVRINEKYSVPMIAVTQIGRNSSPEYLVKNSDMSIFINGNSDSDIEIVLKNNIDKMRKDAEILSHHIL